VQEWTTEHFEEMSWHDNHVHGVAITAGEHGTGELILDLDYILDWLPPIEDRYSFRVAPATLTFHSVSDLTLGLNYGSVGAALSPFSLQSIGREAHVFPNGYSTFRWRLAINWPEGEITFIASGFTQVLRAAPVVSANQCLAALERAGPTGSA
jgi:hypothetical protein